ncbi:unnamed protein product [Ectocarpus sp. 12 AP-2014]
MEERLPRRSAVRSVSYLRTFQDIFTRPGFHYPFVRRKRGVWRPRPPREQGRQWQENSVATAQERQSRKLQRGKHGWLPIFGGA